MSKAVIEIEQLGTRIGDRWIHRQLDLTVNQGEIMVLVGGSGSGKTVLLHEMIALRRVSAGNIRVLGSNLVGISRSALLSIQQRWGVLFQQNALFSSLTVLENVLFPLKERVKLDDDLAMALGLMKMRMAGLAPEAAFRYPSELSGGMQKRAALARAIILDPELLFLDEPTAGLDPGLVADFDRLILNLQKALGLTIVMVTHDVTSMQRTANRVAFLGEGKVLCVGSLKDVMAYPHPLIKTFFAET